MKRQRLIELRDKHGMTQAQVAKQADLARSYYGFIENGTRNPTLGKAIRIAEVFGLSLEEAFPDDIFFNEKSYVVKRKCGGSVHESNNEPSTTKDTA